MATTQGFSPVEEDYTKLAIDVAGTAGFAFSSSGLGAIQGIVNAAAVGDRIRDDEARKSLEMIVTRMVQLARKEDRLELDDALVKRVRQLLCPLPPWFPAPCN